jgi:hypothetical protein
LPILVYCTKKSGSTGSKQKDTIIAATCLSQVGEKNDAALNASLLCPPSSNQGGQMSL